MDFFKGEMRGRDEDVFGTDRRFEGVEEFEKFGGFGVGSELDCLASSISIYRKIGVERKVASNR